MNKPVLLRCALVVSVVIGLWPVLAIAAADGLIPSVPPDTQAVSPELFGIPADFILFALTLLGVAIFHHHVLAVA